MSTVSVLHQDEGGIGKSIPAAQFPETQEISRGRDRIGQYYPAGRDGQQIHPRRVVLIDSVKINPSLLMMTDWDRIG